VVWVVTLVRVVILGKDGGIRGSLYGIFLIAVINVIEYDGEVDSSRE
jgi:hypothetical protein